MKKIIFALSILSLVGCNAEHITLETEFWHSEICHPEIWYKGNPPNAVPECKWTPVYPPGQGLVIK